MSRFTAIPSVPQSGVDYWQSQMFTSLKSNVELLAGIGTELDGRSKALTRGQIGISTTPVQTMTRVTARGSGFTISGQKVAGLEDYGVLINNVQQLANDVANLRSAVNTLINQLRG